jgi:subtilisin family serine protease
MRVLAGLLFTVCLFAATPAYAADRVVVRFSSSADSADRSAARASGDATSAKALPGLSGVQVVTVPEGDAGSAARTLDNADGVLWAQPDHRVHAAIALPSGGASLSSNQWGLLNDGSAILDGNGSTILPAGVAHVDGNFTNAWDTTEGAGVTIAVVDTGVDFTIPDLAANRSTAGAYDFVDRDTDPSPEAAPDPSVDETSHGTHVAGIAAASFGVSQSWGDVTGGAPAAKIMAVRALDENGSGWDSDIAAAFSYAADHGARVVNASLGGAGASDAMHQAIASHPNTLFVVAAGNDGQDAADDYPCADPDPNVICVAAVDNQGALADFSNYGAATVDVAAPGVGILSYVHGHNWLEYWDGTSMATPYVSAAAALAFAAHPCSTPDQVRSAMIQSAHHLAGLAGRTVSGGMIDASALLPLNSAEPTAPRLCSVVTLSTAAPSIGHAVRASGAFDRGTVSWRWQRCAATCATIPGATASTYTPQAADAGKRLQATATATDAGGSTASTSAQTAAVPAPPAPPVAPKPTPTPTPTPVAPAPASPKLSLYKPHRRGSKLAISGRVRWSFRGTVTLKACVGRHCRTARVKAHSGRYAAKLRPSRHGRVVVTASVHAGAGFKAGRAKRTVRF